MDDDLSSLRTTLVRRRQQYEALSQETELVTDEEIFAAQVARRVLSTVILDIDQRLGASAATAFAEAA